MRAVLPLAVGVTGECFVTPVWPEDAVVVQPNITYGSSYNHADAKQEDLLLDAYFPPATDQRKLRPGVVLVHGGSFMSGDKTSDGEPDLARFLAARGYVAVSIDYRLMGKYYGLETDKPPKEATEDARAAVRFMRKMAADWRIDTERLTIGGDSAGAFTSLFYGFAKVAQYEGKSGNPGFSSQVRLSLPISGALKDEAFCASVHPEPTKCALEGDFDYTQDVASMEGTPALAMIHGTEDLTVPYVNGMAMYEAARKAGVESTFVTLEGAGHVPLAEFFASSNATLQLTRFMVQALDLAHAECPHNTVVV
mmetsp:Transcript_79100/g.181003  ORF Transcript_79100/g.181003 Transcript_79100/m.181003 type:complete len:309 (+) Transcript_79100:61-987(+)